MVVSPFHLGGSVANLATDFQHEVTSNLVQSRKFHIYDGSLIGEIAAHNENVTAMAMQADEVIADYTMLGSIDTFSRQQNTIAMRTTGREITQESVSISYRIIHFPIRRILHSSFYNDNLTQADFDTKVFTDGMVIEKVGLDLCSEILNLFYPITIVSLRGDKAALNMGKDLIEKGSNYDVFIVTDAIRDT